jgi:hypothetical protein
MGVYASKTEVTLRNKEQKEKIYSYNSKMKIKKRKSIEYLNRA